MESRKQKNSVLFFVKSAAFLVLFFLLFCADAKPFVLKSVDGSWLPMIAQKWEAKNGGVLVKLADGIKPNELRDMLVNERIPNLNSASLTVFKIESYSFSSIENTVPHFGHLISGISITS